MSIALPVPNRVGPHVLMGGFLQWKGPRVMLARSTQQLRGRLGHFRATNPVLDGMSAPVDELMTHGGANNERVDRPNAEIWKVSGYSTSAIETRISDETCRGALFNGGLLPLLPIEERLSLKMEVVPFARLTADATIGFVSGISVRDREFPRGSLTESKQMRGSPRRGEFGNWGVRNDRIITFHHSVDHTEWRSGKCHSLRRRPKCSILD